MIPTEQKNELDLMYVTRKEFNKKVNEQDKNIEQIRLDMVKIATRLSITIAELSVIGVAIVTAVVKLFVK